MKYLFLILLFLIQTIGVIKAEKTEPIINSTNSTIDHNFVPADIVKSEVKWLVRSKQSIVDAEATIFFYVKKKGIPFLLLNPNSQVEGINGKKIALIKMTKLNGNYFALDTTFEKNRLHSVKIKYHFKSDFVNNKTFLPLNYSKHQYIEGGIPANHMGDRFKVSLTIYLDSNEKFKIIANGKVHQQSKKIYKVNFPEYTSISHFIDIVSEDDIVKPTKSKKIKSINGREIEVFVYSTKDDKAKHLVPIFSELIEQTFYDLEKRFGPYPYNDRIIMKVSNKKSGNGSFAGALALSSFYVEHMAHELGHHWFLQSVSPLNGADTWFYEGLGYWIPYLKILGGFEKVPNLKKSINLKKGPYSLWSSDDIFRVSEIQSPHQSGAMIIAAINTALKKRIVSSTLSLKEKELYKKEGLDIVLRKIAQQKLHSTFSTLDFKEFLENDTGIDFSDIFNFYMIY